MRNNESGRSMVEMLGVLAVIGVLSIGGIAGYMMAMNRHHSNNVLEGVSARAVIISTQKMMGRSAMHPADMETNIDGYPVTVGEADDVGQDYFEVVVSDVPQGPCRYVLNQNWAVPEGIYLNNAVDSAEDGSDCREENNTIAFVFSPSMGGGSNVCGYCQHDENGTCVADETCDNGCSGNNPMKSSSGTCFSCGWSYALNGVDATECAKCPNRSMRNGKCARDRCPDGEWLGESNICYDCGTDSAIYGSKAECAKCPNREIKGGNCVLKECPDGTFRNSTDSCIGCGSEYGFKANATECDKCPDRDMQEGVCMLNCPNGQFRQYEKQSNFCHSCGYVWATTVHSAQECAKCPEREMYNGKCVLKECSNEAIRSSKGDCLPCSHAWEISADATECAKCPNRKMTDDGKCILK